MPRATVAGPPTVPEVTVVVICYNDRDRLPEAIRSVQHQSLHNIEILVVDDASTDGSADVANEMAKHDARVRVIQLHENSGGCSAPRNAGIDEARAPYVMFLDSDDHYDRHACRLLLLTAERTEADVVSGQVIRVHVADGRQSGWFTRLYTERAVYAGIRDNPELFFDPLSTNKLYRRELLDRHRIRFPVGVHYEDSLFSAQVYCLAESIAVIPNAVYYWRVEHAEEGGPDASITQRRHEIDNFRDRIAVHRMMDEFMAGAGFADLKAHKDVKFVRHDLRLYLRDLRYRDEAYQLEFMRLAADYLGTVGPETLQKLNPVERINVAMIRRMDVDETMRTVDYLRFGYKLSTSLVCRGDRVLWTERYADDPSLRDVLDVTELGLHRLPIARLPFHNEVHAVEPVGGRIRLQGRVLNQLDRIPDLDGLRLTVSVKNRDQPERRRQDVDEVTHEGDRIAYRVDLDLRRLLTGLDVTDGVWDMRLEITWQGKTIYSPFSLHPDVLPDGPVAFRGRLLGLLPVHVSLVLTTRMNLTLEQASPESAFERVAARLHWFATRAQHSVSWRSRAVLSHPALIAKGAAVARRLPVRRGLTVFESHMGQQFSDSPRYIFEAAARRGFETLGLRPVWAHQALRPVSFPTDVRLVRRGGWRYHLALARAQFWVDNQGFPREVRRRRETTYVQTWHGTPLKRMGFDSPALERAGEAVRRRHRALMRRWSVLLVPSEYFVETFVASYGYQGRLLRCGLPRNDLLVSGVGDDWVRRKKEELNLPLDRPIVLYAPTFRDRDRRLKKPFDVPFSLEAFQRALAGDVFLLVRTHYLDGYRLSPRYRNFAADVSGHHDITELLLISDVLVTDYSSVMFDFANTGRPMIFYVHDYEDYARDQRGTYVDLAEVAPGPMVSDTEGLIAALRDVDTWHPAAGDRYAAFRERFCAYETGTAADRVVDEILAGRGGAA